MKWLVGICYVSSPPNLRPLGLICPLFVHRHSPNCGNNEQRVLTPTDCTVLISCGVLLLCTFSCVFCYFCHQHIRYALCTTISLSVYISDCFLSANLSSNLSANQSPQTMEGRDGREQNQMFDGFPRTRRLRRSRSSHRTQTTPRIVSLFLSDANH